MTKAEPTPAAALLDPATLSIELECTMHGKYQSQTMILAGRTIRTQCPKCREIYDKANAEESKKVDVHAVALNLERAAIPKRFAGKSFDEFIVPPGKNPQSKALGVCQKYADRFGQIKEKGTSLILCGTYGTGKTLLACMVLQVVVSCGATGMYATALNAVRRIKETWRPGDHATESEKQAIAAFVKPDLLVLDEVGVQFGTEAEKLLLFDILNGRYEEVKPTIVISNQDTVGMGAYLGERIMDRLKEGGGYVIPFEWASYRVSRNAT